MGFRTNSYATCWQIIPGKGNFTTVRLSTSRKNRDTGAYEQDFSGYVMMVGQAHAKAQKLRERDRIKLGEVDVTTTFNKEQNREYVNYRCFDLEMADEVSTQPPASQRADSNTYDGGRDDELPF